MQAKYSTADLLPYFRFLASQVGTQREKGRTHDHHIAPRSQFPELENEPSNIITLTVAAHAEAHSLLSEAVPEQRVNAAVIYAVQRGLEKGRMLIAKYKCPALPKTLVHRPAGTGIGRPKQRHAAVDLAKATLLYLSGMPIESVVAAVRGTRSAFDVQKLIRKTLRGLPSR